MEIELQTLVSAFACVVAVAAALFAGRSSHHAKRNADKSLGDLEPFIEVFQVENTLYGGRIPRLGVQLTNHNRRSLLLRKLEMETNGGFIAFRVSDDDGELGIAGIIDVIMDDEEDEPENAPSQYDFDPPLRLPGNRSLGSTPPQYEYLFQVAPRGGHEQDESWNTVVGVNLEYSIDDGPVRQQRFTVEIRRNSVDEFRARFRSIPHLSAREP